MDHKTFLTLLNDWQDGLTAAEQETALLEYAAQCPDCARQLEAARMYKSVIAEMDAEPAVPLKAQAAWRAAIREEKRRATKKLVTRFAAAAAAVCLIAVGTVSAFKNGSIARDRRVETDGIETSVETANADTGAYEEVKVQVEEIDVAREQLEDIAEEYNGTVDFTEQGEGILRVYVHLNGDADDFLTALGGLGEAQTGAAGERICVILSGK